MRNTHLEDHLGGLELQAVELAEQAARAEAQGNAAEATRLHFELDGLYTEMARSAEIITAADGPRVEPADYWS